MKPLKTLHHLNQFTTTALATALATAVLTSSAAAQTLASTAVVEPEEKNPGVEIVRPVEDLSDMIARPRPDRDFINTALVLTDASGRPSVAYCVAYNQRGNAIGRAHTKIPGNGVRLVLASDLSNGLDFFGKIKCKSRSRVSGTAFIIGPEFSDTRVANLHDRAGSVISVPVAISR